MGQAGPVRTRQTGQNRGAQQLLNGPDMVREPQCHSWRAVALIGLTGHGNDLNLRLTPGAIFGCGGQKVDQQLFLRSSNSSAVMVKTPQRPDIQRSLPEGVFSVKRRVDSRGEGPRRNHLTSDDHSGFARCAAQ